MIPVIKATDVETILKMVRNLTPEEKTKEVKQLVYEIQKAKKVPDDKLPQNVIQLNSYFEARFEQGGQQIAMSLVHPKIADLSNQKLSLFSPLGVALIGFKEGDRIEWSLPGGKRTIHILKVSNPECIKVN
ncbi:GreA/GreB family elongation factor [Cyclobacterium plantarum]|uniref:Transcription elongation factor GreAB n=1 Tax=Cyclobacterium plantarum TaxID=2716263 RepID=A0ABX0H7M5_9BACT|nr:GreA/GreB family elongation factor [Cyclobacterium plantarum]NHE57861.1 transcription elongation factor GreAB [Cyclobacterium plantarum]